MVLEMNMKNKTAWALVTGTGSVTAADALDGWRYEQYQVLPRSVNNSNCVISKTPEREKDKSELAM
jgi:hypothetical protein